MTEAHEVTKAKMEKDSFQETISKNLKEIRAIRKIAQANLDRGYEE